jgi:hypothetical protein
MADSAPQIAVTGGIYRERQHGPCDYSLYFSDIRFYFAGSVGSGVEQVKPQNVGSHRLWVKERPAQGR